MATYPNRVKKISEEECRILNSGRTKKEVDDIDEAIYDIGCHDTYVRKKFDWAKSRQGRECRHSIFHYKNYSLLKEWALRNLYQYEDNYSEEPVMFQMPPLSGKSENFQYHIDGGWVSLLEEPTPDINTSKYVSKKIPRLRFRS